MEEDTIGDELYNPDMILTVESSRRSRIGISFNQGFQIWFLTNNFNSEVNITNRQWINMLLDGKLCINCYENLIVAEIIPIWYK